MTNGSLKKVKSIAECSTLSILQCFGPALNNNWSWKLIFVFLRVAVLDWFYCTILDICVLVVIINLAVALFTIEEFFSIHGHELNNT